MLRPTQLLQADSVIPDLSHGGSSKFCVNVKALNLSHHRSSAPSSRPSKKIASWDKVKFQL